MPYRVLAMCCTAAVSAPSLVTKRTAAWCSRREKKVPRTPSSDTTCGAALTNAARAMRTSRAPVGSSRISMSSGSSPSTSVQRDGARLCGLPKLRAARCGTAVRVASRRNAYSELHSAASTIAWSWCSLPAAWSSARRSCAPSNSTVGGLTALADSAAPERDASARQRKTKALLGAAWVASPRASDTVPRRRRAPPDGGVSSTASRRPTPAPSYLRK